MSSAVLGIDIGTRSTKVVLVRADGALLAATEVNHAVSSPRPNHFEHDADAVWWADVITATRAALLAAPSGVTVAAVGLSACGPCLVPVDEAGEPLRPAILYGVDTRATAEIEDVERRVGREAILSNYGMPVSSQTVGPKIDWLVRNEPEVYARTSHFLTANGFVGWRLTGRRCVDHHQAGYFAPYYRDGAWDDTYDRVGVTSRLPELVWSTDVIGTVTAAASSATGLPAGVPVVLGSSDGLTGAYGAGVSGPGDGVLNYGSTLGLTVFAPRTGATGGVWRTPGAIAGEDCLVAGLSTGGVLATWFLEQFGRELPVGSAEEMTRAYGQLAAEAGASPPGADGLLLLPYFAGERTPIYDPDAAGVLIGLRMHHTRGDLYRALLEGTAYGVRHVLAEMARLGAEVTGLRAVGGATTTPLWPQIVSDVTGIPQWTVSPHHGAPVGAAFLAAVGAGVVADFGALSRWVSLANPVVARPAHRSLYDARFALYLETYRRTRPLLDRLRADSVQHASPDDSDG